jgi:hypothetical protein
LVVVDVRLEPAAALEGRVLSETGEPAEGVVVSAVAAWSAPGIRTPRVVQQTRSDDRGRYRIHTLPAGDFYLTAVGDPTAAFQQPYAPGDRVTGIARTFFPGTPRFDGARPITLRSGEEIRQLDFAVTTVPLASVRGRVITAAGAQAKSYAVRLQPVGRAWRDVSGLIDPRTNEFLFAAVPPGEYWLLASALSSVDVRSAVTEEVASQRLTIAGADLTDVAVQLVEPATVRGRVITERGLPLPNGLALEIVEAAFEMPPAPGASRPPLVVDRDGTLPSVVAWGPAFVRVSGLPDSWALNSVAVDGADVTDTAIDFAASRTFDVRVTLTDATGSVSGIVQARGRPVSARVIAFARDERRWVASSRYIKSTTSSADGRYVIEGLLPGEYGLAALGYLPADAWLDPALLRRLSAAAVPVAIAPHTRIDAALERRDRP